MILEILIFSHILSNIPIMAYLARHFVFTLARELTTDRANFAGISNLEMEQEFELSLVGKLPMALEVLPNLEV